MERTSFAEMRCSLARALELVGDWWTPLVLRDLFIGVKRFDALAEDLGVSRNLLTRRLKALEDHGVIQRRAYQERPRRYEYGLTEAGRDLVPILIALTAWGDRWAQPEQGAPILFRHKACGCGFQPRIVCSACGKPFGADDVTPMPGPGGAALPGTKVVARLLAGSGQMGE
ncbi:winged helix-turn-helix transcriptional regulator [Rhodoblastus sp.]|uniref:winged helix-turn-helix transcriptional regulator n=1 Tax=Rhodoblastus sp. TaxID=1962975 RepID=UPI0035AEB1E9